PPPANMQLMRRVYYRAGAVSDEVKIPPAWSRKLEQAEAELRAKPDSRDRHRAVVRAASRIGDLDRAEEVVHEWIERDKLDPEALTYLSDVLGRRGDREQALRVLSGIVDLEPDNKLLQERLANAFERAGMTERACAHRVTLAEIDSDDAATVARAVVCERVRKQDWSARRILEGLATTPLREAVEESARQLR